jgi:hypothetical protein
MIAHCIAAMVAFVILNLNKLTPLRTTYKQNSNDTFTSHCLFSYSTSPILDYRKYNDGLSKCRFTPTANGQQAVPVVRSALSHCSHSTRAFSLLLDVPGVGFVGCIHSCGYKAPGPRGFRQPDRGVRGQRSEVRGQADRRHRHHPHPFILRSLFESHDKRRSMAFKNVFKRLGTKKERLSFFIEGAVSRSDVCAVYALPLYSTSLTTVKPYVHVYVYIHQSIA